MHIDGKTLPARARLRFHVCVIGAGAAGITVANEFPAGSSALGLIESGGWLPDQTQSLYDGETSESIPERLSYLTASRVRYFGGTTNVWTGWCRPLDESDFDEREWVPHSGWGMPFSALSSYYGPAAQICDIHGFEYDQAQEGHLQSVASLGRHGGLRTRFFHYSPPTRFGVKFREALVASRNVTVATHLNVTELVLDPSGRFITHVLARTLDGNEVAILARWFVLSSGAIENARLLLCSNSLSKQGIGNQRGLVGRFFMEHPHVMRGIVLARKSDPRLLGYRSRTDGGPLGHEIHGVFSPSEEFQRDRKTLNFAAQIMNKPLSPAGGELALGRSLLLTSGQPPGRMVRSDFENVGVEIRTEQAPDPENRVVLSSKLDPFGKNRAKLIWKLNDIEIHTLEEALKGLSSELGLSSLGRLRRIPGDVVTASENAYKFDGARLRLWHHHMGTTRMSPSDASGVVDPDCKVHGVENLFVAGSSVFATSGFANPTLTIVALSLRLARHLKSRIREGGS